MLISFKNTSFFNFELRRLKGGFNRRPVFTPTRETLYWLCVLGETINWVPFPHGAKSKPEPFFFFGGKTLLGESQCYSMNQCCHTYQNNFKIQNILEIWIGQNDQQTILKYKITTIWNFRFVLNKHLISYF